MNKSPGNRVIGKGIGSEEEKRFRDEALSLHRLAIVFGDWAQGDMLDRIKKRGHRTLRRAHGHVLVPIEFAGTRMVDIAKNRHVSKNAIGKIVADLVSIGYVELIPDPEDGRAKILRYTPAGIQMLSDVMAVGQEFEHDLEELIGQRKLTMLKSILQEISDKAIYKRKRPLT